MTETVTMVEHLDIDRPAPRLQLRTRRLLAGAVVLAPTLVAVNSVFHPEVDMTGAGILAGAATDPSSWFVVHVVAALGALLGVPAAFGLRSLIKDRGHRLATSGLVLAVLAAPLLAMTFAAEASVLRLAAGLDPAAGLALAEAYAQTPEFYAVGAAVALTTIGSLLLGAAMVASRSVPRWMALSYLFATVVTVVAAPGTAIGPIAFGVIAIVSVGLGVRVARPHSATSPGASRREVAIATGYTRPTFEHPRRDIPA